MWWIVRHEKKENRLRNKNVQADGRLKWNRRRNSEWRKPSQGSVIKKVGIEKSFEVKNYECESKIIRCR